MYRKFSSLPPKIQRDNQRILSLVARHLSEEGGQITQEMMEAMAPLARGPEECYGRLLAALWGAEEPFYREMIAPGVRRLSGEELYRDAYFQHIPFRGAKEGPFTLEMLRLPALDACLAGDLSLTEEGRLIPPIGFFERDYRYPAILEEGREWMTLLPVELFTMRRPIRSAKGRVLTYGLGLGYFAFHASRKEEVSSVTVVEQSPQVIRLFQKHILPYFPHKEKIRILQGDAFALAQKISPREYDFVFADTWHDALDGIPQYLRFLSLEKEGIQYEYWMEDTLLCYLDGVLFPGSGQNEG